MVKAPVLLQTDVSFSGQGSNIILKLVPSVG